MRAKGLKIERPEGDGKTLQVTILKATGRKEHILLRAEDGPFDLHIGGDIITFSTNSTTRGELWQP